MLTLNVKIFTLGVIFTLRVATRDIPPPLNVKIFMSWTKRYIVQIGGVYVASCQRSTVSSTAHEHKLGAEIGFERGVGWGQDNKRTSPCIASRPCIFKAESKLHLHIESCVSSVCKVPEQKQNHG